MKTDCELFIMPNVGLASPPTNRWRARIERLLADGVEGFRRIAQPSACSFLYTEETRGSINNASGSRVIPAEPSLESSSANIALRCVEAASRHAENRRQLCVFLSPRLIILDDTLMTEFMHRAAAAEGLLMAIWAENRHPCLITREEEDPKGYAWAHNYRQHKLEAPGLWHLDERGEYPIDSRTGRAIMHRQQFYPVYSLKHALFSLRFDRLKDFSRILSEEAVEPFVLAENNFIYMNTMIDVLKAYHRISPRQGMPTSPDENSRPPAWISKRKHHLEVIGNHA